MATDERKTSLLLTALLSSVVLLVASVAGLAIWKSKQPAPRIDLTAFVDHPVHERAAWKAWALESGILGRVDISAAREVLEVAAKEGDPVAAMELAVIGEQENLENYRLSGGFSERVALPVKELADSGDPSAQLALARFRAWLLPGTDSEIITLVTSAAQQGYEPAYVFLGSCYLWGLDTMPDPDQAEVWLDKAAKLGDANALFSLGYSYGKVDWPRHDFEVAADYMRQAAEIGLFDAMAGIGFCYLNGKGVETDLSAAFRWFQRGAELGEPESLYNVGYCYRYGVGVSADAELAKYFLNLAVEAGNDKAEDALAAFDSPQRERSGNWPGR